MQKLLFSLLGLMCSVMSYSQNDLSVLYSSEQLSELEIDNPEIIEYWTTYLEHGWGLDTIKSDQELTGEILLSLNYDFNKNRFNPLEYGIFPKEGTQYIGIERTDLVLIVYPKSHIIYLYNKNKNK